MKEYRLEGLSCANCAASLESEIKKLEHGEKAKVQFNSSKLVVSEQVDMKQVEKILASDGASIVPEAKTIEYKLEGLSCANCAATLEKEIQKLDFGQDAKVHFASNKLVVHEQADLDAIKKILASDGAAIMEAQKETHHDQGHHRMDKMKRQLIGSVLLFIGALIVGKFDSTYAVPIYILAIGLSGYSTFLKGLKNLAKFTFNMDSLMTIALTGAVLIGEWKEATVVAILFGLNEMLESYGMQKARKSMESLLNIAPKEATLLGNGEEKRIPIEHLKVHDVVIVKAGEKIPSDGIVVQGMSSVNEAAITGESLPIDKQNGDFVFGGSINNEGVLYVQMEKEYEDSSLAKILHLVEEAQEAKTPTELFVNEFAKYYTPAIIIIAMLVMFVPPLLLGAEWMPWIYQGLAVLIVGCPCALILSFPIAIVSGLTVNARNGILVKGGVVLEQLGQLKQIAFDKTGTLTKGKPHVAHEKMYDQETCYLVSAAIEQKSSHPLAQAVFAHVVASIKQIPTVEDIQTLPGLGVTAVLHQQTYRIGNEKIIRDFSLSDAVKQDIKQMKAQGLTLVVVSDEKQVLGIFGLEDEIRPESKKIIADLHEVGIQKAIMVTGDHMQTAEKVAQQIGLDEYYGNLLPEQKVAKIKELTQVNKTAMVGDGINDAPALATANVGIAMGKGTDSAIEVADVVLMQDHLGKLPQAISISKKVNRIIKVNLLIALSLKLIALLLTIPGMLTLWIAILSDMGATIIVTLTSLTILLQKTSR
ncbi:heavy metal translocating P-type ATPase [Massilibacterium senegalense]|uniref:heavy metal translocating P-type ATPase n=1 Tax=Massilibacterium senegalense TaxID=1632858 RepID=UPI0007828607|nr:cation-translocating P-type ATPase [Massilibacterium senegalense]